jgi:hypothetical protein
MYFPSIRIIRTEKPFLHFIHLNNMHACANVQYVLYIMYTPRVWLQFGSSVVLSSTWMYIVLIYTAPIRSLH